jgi:putative transposase
MRTSARTRYAGYRFPAEIIGHGVWLYFRFPLGLRMVEELLAARGIIVSHETVRQWARKFGQPFANQIRRRLPRVGDKWHLDEVVLKIAGVKHWLWRAVDQAGVVLDVLVQRRRNKQAAKRLLRKLLKRQMRPPRVMITDKLASYGAAKREENPGRGAGVFAEARGGRTAEKAASGGLQESRLPVPGHSRGVLSRHVRPCRTAGNGTGPPKAADPFVPYLRRAGAKVGFRACPAWCRHPPAPTARRRRSG